MPDWRNWLHGRADAMRCTRLHAWPWSTRPGQRPMLLTSRYLMVNSLSAAQRAPHAISLILSIHGDLTAIDMALNATEISHSSWREMRVEEETGLWYLLKRVGCTAASCCNYWSLQIASRLGELSVRHTTLLVLQYACTATTAYPSVIKIVWTYTTQVWNKLMSSTKNE